MSNIYSLRIPTAELEIDKKKQLDQLATTKHEGTWTDQFPRIPMLRIASTFFWCDVEFSLVLCTKTRTGCDMLTAVAYLS